MFPSRIKGKHRRGLSMEQQCGGPPASHAAASHGRANVDARVRGCSLLLLLLSLSLCRLPSCCTNGGTAAAGAAAAAAMGCAGQQAQLPACDVPPS